MSVPGESFVDLLKDALEHLYDPVHLRSHPLASLLLRQPLPFGVSSAQALRQVLLDGIERLNYSTSLPSGARQNRPYQILVLRYVEALPYRDVMAELSLSQPQFHREQRHALEALAALLEAGNAPEKPSAETQPPDDVGSYAELEAVARRGEGPAHLDDVVQGVVSMLADVAARAGVTLKWEPPASPTVAVAHRTALRQLLIGLVGYILCGASGGELVVQAGEEKGDGLSAVYRGRIDRVALEQPEARDRLVVVSRLAAALQGTLSLVQREDELRLVVRLPVAPRTLLVIDDNADAIQLVARLLADQQYTVVSAGDVRTGLALARSSRPDAILLDIMMPDQDGWDALQALKHDPVTQEVPILVCTVLAESRLALALGAVEFIRKPLTRPRLLAALARWTAPRPLAEERRGSSGSGPAVGSPIRDDR